VARSACAIGYAQVTMIVFAREVFVCKCSTDVPADDPEANELSRKMRFVKGGEREIAQLDRAHHNDEHVADFRARLARGEHWMVGLVDEKIVTYTWLFEPARPVCEYPYLPGCAFEIAKDVGYGYDAWTPPDLRGGGLRRRAFLEELHTLRSQGKMWEASYFVKHQLEGATRSLGKVGIVIEPLWRVTIKANKKLAVENLAPNDKSTKPAFVV
jgi:hypothetical protein